MRTTQAKAILGAGWLPGAPLLALVLATMSAPVAQAVNYWFDTNQGTAGYGVADEGSYNWMGANNWNTASGGGSGTYVTWPNSYSANDDSGIVNDLGAGTSFTVTLGASDDQTINIGDLGLNWDLTTATALGDGNVVIGGVSGTGTLVTRANMQLGTAAGTLTINCAYSFGSTSYGTTFRGGNVVINGVVSDANPSVPTGVPFLTQNGNGLGGGTLTLANTANTYTGRVTATWIASGFTLAVTKLADGGQASSIGTSSANIALNGGTLKFIGTGAQSTDLGFHLASGGGTVDASGPTAGDTITISGAPSYSAVNLARTITLTGTNTGANTIAFNYEDNGSGTCSLIKNGSGTWVMSGTNAYTGTTALNVGRLLINGVHTGGGTYTVANATTLGGRGTIACPITLNSGATLAPGGIDGFGSLTVSNAVTVSADRTLAVKVGDLAQDEFGQLRVGSGVTVTLGGALTIDDSAGSGNGTITIVNVSELGGTRSGTFSNFPNDGDTYAGTRGTWTLNYEGGAAGSGDVTLTLPPLGTVVSIM
jgi:fibronectin-binding autotransporter adhesin